MLFSVQSATVRALPEKSYVEQVRNDSPVSEPVANAVHTCETLCHEGECGACSRTSKVYCRCALKTKEVPCASLKNQAEVMFLCDKRCNKKLPCGRHKCSEKCCVDKEHKCPLICGRKLNCGVHRCEEPCHRGNCQKCWQTRTAVATPTLWLLGYAKEAFEVDLPPPPNGAMQPARRRLRSRPSDTHLEGLRQALEGLWHQEKDMARGGSRGGGGSQGGAEEQGQALTCTQGNLAGRAAAAKAMRGRAGGKGHGNCQLADSLSPSFLASKLQPEEASLLPFFTLRWPGGRRRLHPGQASFSCWWWRIGETPRAAATVLLSSSFAFKVEGGGRCCPGRASLGCCLLTAANPTS
ncbi:UNVERIFIED_CONTAM: hypothetical protein K2H54_003796 [Gekko kuhli]